MTERLKEFREFREKMNARITRAQFLEAFNVALVVGGSITIPHLRSAVATLDELEAATGDLG
jgi:hypothetical protein